MHVLPAVLVFIAVMLIIILNAQSTQRQNDIELQETAASRARTVETEIRARIMTYEEVARASSAFIGSSQEVTREEFIQFIRTFRLSERYPGLQYVAYAQYVDAEDINGYVEQQRQKGTPDFSVFPEVTSDRGLITSLSVAHLPTTGNVVGFDMISEPVRAAAVNEAIKSGKAIISENVRLISNPESGQGFILFVPVYRSAEQPNDAGTRLQAAIGVVGASFITSNFFDALFKSDNDDSFGFKIRQGNNPPMYTSDSYDRVAAARGSKQTSYTFTVNDREWEIDYAFAEKSLGTGLSIDVLRSLAGGVLFSSLLAILVFVLLMSRTRSLGHAEEREIQNAKDDLLSLASHQLRTPATSVKQYLGMVKDGFAGDLNEQQAQLLDEAYESNERQLGIINEMLYVARADAGRIVLDRASVSLNKLLRDIHKDQFQRAKSFQQRLNLIVPKMDVIINGDAHYLRMSIENVVSNAIKYTPEKGTITVKLSRTKSDAVITVTDTGVGISKQDHKKIFDKFSRVPNELSTRTNGTGVGLYLTKQIVELHDGKVSFTSDSGKGTTFTISLPRLTDDHDQR